MRYSAQYYNIYIERNKNTLSKQNVLSSYAVDQVHTTLTDKCSNLTSDYTGGDLAKHLRGRGGEAEDTKIRERASTEVSSELNLNRNISFVLLLNLSLLFVFSSIFATTASKYILYSRWLNVRTARLGLNVEFRPVNVSAPLKPHVIIHLRVLFRTGLCRVKCTDTRALEQDTQGNILRAGSLSHG